MTDVATPNTVADRSGDDQAQTRHDDASYSHTRLLIRENARLINAAAFFVLMMLTFIVLEPDVFLGSRIYTSVFTTMPFLLFMVIPAVFLVTSGEIDLSFGAVFGLSAYVFAIIVDTGGSFWIGLVAALTTGAVIGALNGTLVTYIGLSSLVATLGMNFLLRGLVLVLAEGKGIPLTQLRDTAAYNIFLGKWGPIPVQMFWAAGASLIGIVLFTRHRFGVRIRCVGDNSDAAREMGINVNLTRSMAFIYMGVSAAFSGVLSTMLLSNWFGTAGDGFLLLVLAAVFVGGTPTWGGVGTVAGGVIGAFFIGFAETGIITVGLTGFYTQLIFGLIIIMSLVGQRLLPGGTES